MNATATLVRAGLGLLVCALLAGLIGERCSDAWARCETKCQPHRVASAVGDACECDMRWERR